MEEGRDLSFHGKSVVTEANLRDEYYWKLVADFIGPQSGEGLDLEQGPCKNRFMIQVGLIVEDNNFPWIAIVHWLKKIFPGHQSADFRCLVERGIATTLSLGVDARLTFLESNVNFNFVGPICDSIGVERQHLLELKDFSERAQFMEVTNGLIVELINFVSREKLSPVVIVTWLRNFNPEFCTNGNLQKAYKSIKPKIKKLKMHCGLYETRRHRKNAAIEALLQSPFELVPSKIPKQLAKKRVRREDYDIVVKEECESYDVTQGEGSEVVREALSQHHNDLKFDEGVNESSGGAKSSEDSRVSLTLLDIAMLTVQKLQNVSGAKIESCKQISLDLLKNHYILTYKEHPAMEEFEKKVGALRHKCSLVPPVVFLNYNAHFLVHVHEVIEQQILNFEKDIIMSTGEKLGRDKLPTFKNFVGLPESATCRYVHMACDILCPRSPESAPRPGKPDYRKHWVAFCKEKGNPSKLAVNQSNRFKSYFEAAAGLIHHHKEIALFFSDLLAMTNEACPNIILQSVAADANDSTIQSFVCVLAIVYCKVLGPYWQLLNSGAEYSLFSQYLLCFYQKFLDWSKDPSTLLQPEETTNVFKQFPLQEKALGEVFNYCGQWHANRELIRVCLKGTIKVIATVTEEHLKDFLPGGVFSQIPSEDVCLQLVSCTFSVLMADYPFSYEDLYQKRKPGKEASSKTSQWDSSVEDEVKSSSGDSDDGVSGGTGSLFGQKEDQSPQTKKGSKPANEEAVEVNMDLDYISATVSRNGGPCKTQQDVDKLLLQFEEKPRVEKQEAVRCEMVYQKMVLNNPDPRLDCTLQTTTQMVLKLKLALPRIKPGYSLVLAPRKTRPKGVTQMAPEPPAAQVVNMLVSEEHPDCQTEQKLTNTSM
uniref:Uncharacterized protein n=1 Tax=Nothobranchius korthausae TaxID=1143690 RepID=A0A1A8H3J9_9TELE